MTPPTLNSALERAAGSPETGIRLLDRREREEWHPWSDIRRRAAAAAGSLAALGIERGERVALVYPTGSQFFDAFFGALLAGAVPVPLYPPVRLGRLAEYERRTARMLEAAGTRLVLADGRVRRLLGEAVAEARPRHGCLTLEELPSAEPVETKVDPDDLAMVQYSSGTTVEPKPVALSHRAVMAQVEALNGFWPDTAEVRHSGVSWLPLYHDMGLIGGVFPALERPGVLSLLPPEAFVVRPALWLRAISRYGATISPAPNFAYGLCVEKVRDEEMEGVDLSCWRVALNGAEPVAPSVLRAFGERFSRWGFDPTALTPVYGLSEAALAVTFSDLDRPFASRRFSRAALVERGEALEDPQGMELVGVGRPLPGFRLSLRDEAGEELGDGRVGRLWVQGPSLMEGYLGLPEATSRALRDGWLDTGDLGFMWRGELYLTGRAKDVLIIRGRNHLPQEVEQAVDGLPEVRTGCAAAVSHLPPEGEREEVLLFVERRRGGRTPDAELAERCRQEVLAATGVPIDRVVVLDPGTLPRTSSGKIRRIEALRLHLAGELEPPKKVSVLGLLGAVARSRRALRRSGPEGS